MDNSGPHFGSHSEPDNCLLCVQLNNGTYRYTQHFSKDPNKDPSFTKIKLKTAAKNTGYLRFGGITLNNQRILEPVFVGAIGIQAGKKW